MAKTSPVPGEIRTPAAVVASGQSFWEVLPEVMKGRRIRRAVWPAPVYVEMFSTSGEEGRLIIFLDTDNLRHPWTISASDMEAEDWETTAKLRLEQ